MDPVSALSVDHVVLLVSNLQEGMADYEGVGFSVVPGGEHADGVTHNALIAFQDGSYLELIAFKQPAPEGHHFARGAHAGEGLIDYALLPLDINLTIKQARKRGLKLRGPFPGGRLRPDGREIAWQTARSDTPDLPFLCADVTPREYRVPSGEVCTHANGVTGLAGLTVAVANLEASRKRYQALLGMEQLPGFGMPASREPVAAFQLKETTVTLIQPVLGPAMQNLEKRGEGVFSLVLRGGEHSVTEHLSPERTHGSRIEIVHELMPQHSEIES